jgi:hypothetical protein
MNDMWGVVDEVECVQERKTVRREDAFLETCALIWFVILREI